MTFTESLLIYLALAASTAINIIVPLPGSAVVTPLLALLTDPGRAIGLASFSFFLNGLVRVWLFRKNIQWAEVRSLLLPSALAALLGALTLFAIPPRFVLIIIFIFAVYFLLKKLKILPTQKEQPAWVSHFVGILSGFLQGAGLAGSDIRNQYLYAQGLELKEVHGTTALVGATNFLIATVVRLYVGTIAIPDLTSLFMYIFPLIILGTWLGRHLLRKLSKPTTDKIVLVIMVVVVVSLAYKLLV